MAYYKFTRDIRAGVPIDIYNHGNHARDFTYIDNVVSANISAATMPNVGGEIINIACGRRITINEFNEAIEAAKKEGITRLDKREKLRLIWKF